MTRQQDDSDLRQLADDTAQMRKDASVFIEECRVALYWLARGQTTDGYTRTLTRAVDWMETLSRHLTPWEPPPPLRPDPPPITDDKQPF